MTPEEKCRAALEQWLMATAVANQKVEIDSRAFATLVDQLTPTFAITDERMASLQAANEQLIATNGHLKRLITKYKIEEEG